MKAIVHLLWSWAATILSRGVTCPYLLYKPSLNADQYRHSGSIKGKISNEKTAVFSSTNRIEIAHK